MNDDNASGRKVSSWTVAAASCRSLSELQGAEPPSQGAMLSSARLPSGVSDSSRAACVRGTSASQLPVGRRRSATPKQSPRKNFSVGRAATGRFKLAVPTPLHAVSRLLQLGKMHVPLCAVADLQVDSGEFFIVLQRRWSFQLELSMHS